MRYPVFIVPFLPAAGMALFPFILVKSNAIKADPVVINHERIHLRQQIELLLLPFYLFYALNYVLNLVIYLQHDAAYRNIAFEREAYRNDHNMAYLKKRKLFCWIYYIFR